MNIKRIYASDLATLTSNVHTGGGIDDTQALQAVLDEARDEHTGVYLIMDGAALVTQLKLYSNTTIECLTADCGFYQADWQNQALICCGDPDYYQRKTHNIALLGGTYNQNGQHQEHDNHRPEVASIMKSDDLRPGRIYKNGVMCIELYGVEHLVVRDVILRDFRTYAFMLGCFKHVTLENVWLELPHGTRGNQDGFHFWGPGQFLNVLHCGGKVGDDIINLGPDEHDKKSSITDVLVDGIFVDDGEQAVRLLSRGTGALDRVTIRNVTGVYRSYGFYIDPWFVENSFGNFRNILIENVDLKCVEKTYSAPPFLFSIAGNIECLTLKNIRHHNAHDNRPLVEVGLPYYATNRDRLEDYDLAGLGQRVQNLIIDGVTVVEHEDEPRDTNYINVFCNIENLVLKNVLVVKNQEENGTFVHIGKTGHIDNLICESIHTKGLKTWIDDDSKVGSQF